MKEKDKIYATVQNGVLVGASCKPYQEADEYVRKDALLEWAKEEQAKCSSETHPYYQFMNVLIEKLKDFRP